ncbi:hypothetical protein HG531_000567 [Fusarium graminearum]|nr:hypothetical protein HG531_000567 [Fusarium graminearum]
MPSWSMRVTGSWKQENLGQQLDQRQWDANSTLVPRKWKRYKSENTPSVLAKESGDLVSNSLCANENEDLVLLVLHDLLHVLNHAVTLLHLGNNLNDLCNSVVGSKLHGTNVDLDEVLEEVGSESTDFLRPGSGPHEGLSVRSDLTNDLADLGLETHVKHAISLVEDEIGNTTQVGLTGLEHVNETTGSGNAHLDSAREVANLRTLGDTTVDTGVSDARRSTELLHLFLDLDSKLTSRSEDKNNGAVTGGEERLGVDVNDGGKAVGEGLSGTSLGNTNDIATGESHGPTLRLDGGGSRETLSLDLIHNISGEASLVEGLDRLGNVRASNGHLVLAAESLNIGIRSGFNVGVLLVERLLELGKAVDI